MKAWDASIQCDGGPVLVCDLDTFLDWVGAAPLQMLRAHLPPDHPMRKRLPVEKRLRIWGNLTAELPEPFRFVGGGHRLIECASLDDARAKLVELREAVRASFDGALADEVDTHGSFRFARRDGAQLSAQLDPNSLYDEVWQSHDTALEGYFHPIKGVPALFWQMEGAGVADVSLSADRSQLVLVRSWLSGDEKTEADEIAQIRELASRASDDEDDLGEITIKTGAAAIVWSPIGHQQVSQIFGEPDVPTRLEKESVVTFSTQMLPDIGAALRVPNGRWRATAGRHENDVFHCHWCRPTHQP